MSELMLLRSKRVLVDDQLLPGVVKIRDGFIQEVADYNDWDASIGQDMGNAVLMPGVVDCHVHINEPGRTDWEGFNTATQSAAAGGITTLVDMPLNCIPATVSKEALEQKIAAVKDKLWIDCGFWGGVIPDNLEQLDELLEAGVLGVKSFLIDSGVEEFPPVSAEHIRLALPILNKHKVPYLIHAELDKDQHEEIEIGNSYDSFLQSRPKKWENDAIDLMLQLTQEAQQQGLNNHIHIVHLSSDQGIERIRAARQNGINISAETCPHYLALWAEDIPDGKTLFKCCPPIREKANCENLWQGLEQGIIDFIVSDHSPCTPSLKRIDTGDIEKAWGGISSLQFSLSLIWTEAHSRGISLQQLSRWMSWNTAKFCGLSEVKGKLAPGYQADILVFDPESEYEIDTDKILYKHKITPYAGRKVKGKVLATYLRGECIWKNDKLQAQTRGQTILKGKGVYA